MSLDCDVSCCSSTALNCNWPMAVNNKLQGNKHIDPINLRVKSNVQRCIRFLELVLYYSVRFRDMQQHKIKQCALSWYAQCCSLLTRLLPILLNGPRYLYSFIFIWQFSAFKYREGMHVMTQDHTMHRTSLQSHPLSGRNVCHSGVLVQAHMIMIAKLLFYSTYHVRINDMMKLE